MATLKHLDTQSFDLAIKNAETPVLVDFYADWCGPCKALAPVLESVAETSPDSLSVVKVDIDDNPELAVRFGIQKIPTLVLFSGGEVQDQITGLLSKGDLLARLDPFIAAARPAVH